MQENPYSGILRMIGDKAAGQIPAAFRYGTVKSVSPLVVTVSKTDQSGNDLLKNADLGELHIGDSLLLVPMDNDQKFLILCRMVSV